MRKKSLHKAEQAIRPGDHQPRTLCMMRAREKEEATRYSGNRSECPATAEASLCSSKIVTLCFAPRHHAFCGRGWLLLWYLRASRFSASIAVQCWLILSALCTSGGQLTRFAAMAACQGCQRAGRSGGFGQGAFWGQQQIAQSEWKRSSYVVSTAQIRRHRREVGGNAQLLHRDHPPSLPNTV